MGLAGILVAIVVLFIFAYIGMPVLVLSFIATLIVTFTNGLDFTTALSELYLGGAANSFVLIILPGIVGAIIAEFYKETGAAAAIARGILKASNKIFKENKSVVIPIVVINVIGLVICYGGINGVIAIIILMPVVLEILKSYNMPRYLAPGIILGATCTAAMTMPGSPQSQNYLPSLYLGTSATAGLVPGLIAGIVVIVLNVMIMAALTKRAMKKGEKYEDLPEILAVRQVPDEELPNFFVSLIPMVVTLVLYAGMGMNLLLALLVGCVLCIPCFFNKVKSWKTFCEIFTHGSMDSCGLLLVVCALSGFGAVVAATDSFTMLCSGLMNIPGPATFKVLIAMAITVMIAGSGPAGETAGVPMFSQTFLSMGVSPAAFHRIAAFTGTCLDTLPSNAGVNIASKLSGYSIKETYKYCFLTSVLTTSIGAVVVTILLTIMPNAV